MLLIYLHYILGTQTTHTVTHINYKGYKKFADMTPEQRSSEFCVSLMYCFRIHSGLEDIYKYIYIDKSHLIKNQHTKGKTKNQIHILSFAAMIRNYVYNTSILNKTYNTDDVKNQILGFFKSVYEILVNNIDREIAAMLSGLNCALMTTRITLIERIARKVCILIDNNSSGMCLAKVLIYDIYCASSDYLQIAIPEEQISDNKDSANKDSANKKSANIDSDNIQSDNIQIDIIQNDSIDKKNLDSNNIVVNNIQIDNKQSDNIESANIESANIESAAANYTCTCFSAHRYCIDIFSQIKNKFKEIRSKSKHKRIELGKRIFFDGLLRYKSEVKGIYDKIKNDMGNNGLMSSSLIYQPEYIDELKRISMVSDSFYFYVGRYYEDEIIMSEEPNISNIIITISIFVFNRIEKSTVVQQYLDYLVPPIQQLNHHHLYLLLNELLYIF